MQFYMGGKVRKPKSWCKMLPVGFKSLISAKNAARALHSSLNQADTEVERGRSRAPD